jgi:hypothetical protein
MDLITFVKYVLIRESFATPLVGKGAGSVLKGAGQSVGHVFGGGK